MSAPPAPLRRLATSVCVLAILAAACDTIPGATLALPEGRAFLPMVPDSVDDVGLDPSIAVSSDGTPYVTYFGLPAVLGPNDIPVTRPVGAPYLKTEAGDDAAAVLLASMTPDTQVWNRGAVAQPRETPGGVTVPFGPASLPSLKSVTPSNAQGTDVAVSSGGDIHAVWADDTGVWYGLGPDFELEAVERTPEAGAPSIVLDADGAPVVAYAVAGVQPEVRIAERVGERWKTSVVTTLGRCGRGCPPAVQLTTVNGDPFLVVADPESRQLIAAHRTGSAWTSEVVATGITGGASVAAAGDAVTIAYYTPGGVAVATGTPGSWSTEQVAKVTGSSPTLAPSPSPTTGTSPSPTGGASPSAETEKPIETTPTTGVAVDGDGTAWVAWQDGDGVHLASGKEQGTFEEQELSQTEGGVTPTIAATEDGSALYVAWFDPVARDLRVGISTDLGKELLFAAPSPTPPPGGITTGAECGKDGEVALDIVAEGTAFNPTCLVAPAGASFTINFDNRDPASAVGPHNIAIAEDEQTVTTDPLFKGDPVSGPDQVTYDVDALDEGSYFFHCDFHPSMTGTLAVVAAKGGGGKKGGG